MTGRSSASPLVTNGIGSPVHGIGSAAEQTTHSQMCAHSRDLLAEHLVRVALRGKLRPDGPVQSAPSITDEQQRPALAGAVQCHRPLAHQSTMLRSRLREGQ